MESKIGPYQVSERLGTGGMGEVFKAFDDRLDRWVAIKRIRPGKEDTDDNRERFQREAKATAQLNHAAIVHVYDIFRDGESDCIVMEYVEGRTLQGMTVEGPLDPIAAATLAQQIAEGLAAAHAKGILHRDLKTENIIVTPEGNAKILDFGLARKLISNELDASLTGKGQLVGTSRTMSPEYVGGEEIDHRSDLFSLGVLLYETVTGHSPFKAQNTLATLKQVIIHQQLPTREMNPEVPTELSDLIDRLLEKSPEDRPQSAAEVAEDLARITGQASSGSVSRSASMAYTLSGTDEEWSISRVFVDRHLRRYWVGLGVVVVVALVAAYVLGSRSGVTPADLEPGEAIMIVLGRFDNRTNEPLLDNSLELALRIGLEQSRKAYVLPQRQIQASLRRMERDPETPVDRALGIEICQREGARALVMGSIGKIGADYLLSAEIIDPQTGAPLYSVPSIQASTTDDILPALEQAIEQLRSNLGVSLIAANEIQPLAKVTTSDLEALKAYSLGVARSDRGLHAEAVPFLQQAIAVDPGFGMALAKLGAIYRNLQQTEKAAEHLSRALEHSDRLTEFEKIYVQGTVARINGTEEELLRSWTLLSELYPDRYTGHFNRGMVLMRYFNDYVKATDSFASANDTQDASPVMAYAQLGYCYLARGLEEESLASFTAPQEKESFFLRRGIADFYTATGRYEEAQETVDWLARNFGVDEMWAILPRQVLLRVDRGRFQEAYDLLLEHRERVEENPSENWQWHQMTITVLEHLGDVQQLRQVLRSYVELLRTILADTGKQPVYEPIPSLALVGRIGARNSALEEALEIQRLIEPLAQKSRLTIWQSYADILRAEILASQGESTEALAIARKTLNQTNFLAGHETLARLSEITGDLKSAQKEYEWIAAHRNRAFLECAFICPDRSVQIIDSTLALYHLGRIHERLQEPEKAAEYYRQFLERWTQASQSRAWQDAHQRWEALDEPRATDSEI